MKVEPKSPPPNCGGQQQQQQDANPHGGNKRSKVRLRASKFREFKSVDSFSRPFNHFYHVLQLQNQNNGRHQQQEGECNKMLSPEAGGGAYLTVEKYILQLHQKDERVSRYCIEQLVSFP